MKLSIQLVLILVALLLMPLSARAAPERYILQKDQSVVGFTWFFGNDKVKGRMPVADADVLIDFDRLQNSRVSVDLDVTKAKAGFLFATQALTGPKVLWAEKFPTISFVSERVLAKENGAVIEGALTIRGVTKPMAFDAELFRQRGTEEGDRRLLSIVVRGSVSRSAFGADGWSDMVGDTVELTILARIEKAE